MLFIILTGPKCLFLLQGIKCMFITVLPTLRWARPIQNSDEQNQAHKLVKNGFDCFFYFVFVCDFFCMHYNLCFSHAWYSISICTIVSLMAILPFADVLNHSWMHLFFVKEFFFLLLNNSLFPCCMLISRNLFNSVWTEKKRSLFTLSAVQNPIWLPVVWYGEMLMNTTSFQMKLITNWRCFVLFLAPGEVCCRRDGVVASTGVCHSLYKTKN